MDLQALHAAFETGALTPSELLRSRYPSLAQSSRSIFISLAPLDALLEAARVLEGLPPLQRASKALWGVPFAVKDNVDVAGWPTTAACPSFSHIPTTSAPAVQALQDAGS
jgi:Asp-tRNA(Asn)/Glu-tRNA(Gln) amidotransferase A subunit family amidase